MVPWHLIEQEHNPDIAWDIWQHMFLDIADSHAPLKKKRVKGNSFPWITPELKRLMFQRDKLKKLASRFPTDGNWTSYKHMKNKVNYEIKNAKMNYYNAFFKDNRRNIKNTWKGINRLIGNEPKFNKITQLDTGDTVNTDPIEISNILNTHFSKIGPSLASQIIDTSSNFTDYVTPAEHIFNLAKVSCQEVFNLIQKIPNNKASGLDNISARLLKEASPIVTRSLTFIINQSITTGIFPNAWKRARVSPIFKEDLRTDPNNYRPISVLPIVSKLIERVVFNQLYEYLNNNNLLTESQSGFRPMFFLVTCLRADVSYFLCCKRNRRRLHAGNLVTYLKSEKAPLLGGASPCRPLKGVTPPPPPPHHTHFRGALASVERRISVSGRMIWIFYHHVLRHKKKSF